MFPFLVLCFNVSYAKVGVLSHIYDKMPTKNSEARTTTSVFRINYV